MPSKFGILFKELKERGIIKNLFYYLLGAIGFLEGTFGVILFFFPADAFWTIHKIGLSALILCIAGIPIVGIVTWFHGKMGENPITKMEVLLIATCIIIGGSLIGYIMHRPLPITLMARMMDPNKEWFEENIIKEFEEGHNCNVITKTFDVATQIYEKLKMEEQKTIKAGNVSLVKVPTHLTRILCEEGLLRSIEDTLDKSEIEDELNQIEGEFDGLALKRCYRKGITEEKKKLFYLPRKLETRLMIYRKSKVADAAKNWRQYEALLNYILKKENGYGLPMNFHLDSDVNMWDYYDILVAAYYWASTEKTGKVAHRSRDYVGTILGLIDRATELGADEQDIKDMYPFSDAIIDMFHWEAIFRKYSLYCEGMWDQFGWTGLDIYNGIKEKNVYLAWMHQLDCVLIHGEEKLRTEGYIDDKEDLGVAIMPQGVSFELTDEGIPKRLGTRQAHTYGWFWGIPERAAEPELAYHFAKFITNKASHLNECKNFLLIPVRKDVRDSFPNVLKLPWKKEIYDKSMEQLRINGEKLVPCFRTITDYQDFRHKYYDAFEEIVIKRRYSSEGPEGKVDRTFIRDNLR